MCVSIYIYTHTYISIYEHISASSRRGSTFRGISQMEGEAFDGNFTRGGGHFEGRFTKKELIPQPSTINPKPPTPSHTPFTLNS